MVHSQNISYNWPLRSCIQIELALHQAEDAQVSAKELAKSFCE